MGSEAKLRQLKAKFSQLDKNGDGKLDFNELTELLKKGNPRMTTRDVRLLFTKVDVNGDGTVEFDEFVEYLYKDDAPAPAADRSRRRGAADAGPQDDGSEVDWGPAETAFSGYGSGGAVTGTEFKKICQDCGLFDRKYTKQDVDIIFAKVVVRGERKIRFEQFQNALRLVASKKGCSNREVQDKVAASSGPVINATRADDVRFHDDKSLYTGAHADVHGGGNHDDRHARLGGAAAPVADDSEGDWTPVGDAFTDFAGADMDGREFTKLCTDCKLFDRKYSKPDADIVFSKVCPRGQRRIGKELFYDCLRLVADKKGCAVYQVQDIVANSKGPQSSATKADDVRFHDDKSSYTGMHAS